MSNSDAILFAPYYYGNRTGRTLYKGMSESEFLSRSMVQDATVRQIEIISAAPATFP